MRARYLVLAILAVAAAGCSRTLVDSGHRPQSTRPYRTWVMGYASGLVMPGPGRLTRGCVNGVVRLRIEHTPATFAVQTLTAGLLSPREVNIWCAADSRAEVVVESYVGPRGREFRRYESPRAELLDRHYGPRGGRDHSRHGHRW